MKLPLANPDPGPRGYVSALLMVGVSTLVGLIIAPRWGNSAVDLIFLPSVLAVAVFAGLGPALLAAISSALAFNFFFTAPVHTFRIHSVTDVVTVVVLFIVAAVTSQLAASIRTQAQIAEAHAVRNATISGLARKLLSCTSREEIAEVGVAEFAQLFDCNAVLLVGQPEPRLVAAKPATVTLTPSDLVAVATVLATGDAVGRGITGISTVDWQIHPVRTKNLVIAAVGLVRDDGLAPVSSEQYTLLQSLLDQIALALERARLEGEARHFVALRERDSIRSSLLSSIGENFKPPLSAISARVADLKRGGGGDKAVISAIGTEAAKLERHLSNLLDLGSDGDGESIEIGAIQIDLFRRLVSRNGKQVHLTPKEYAVLTELAKYPGRVLTHTHLLRTAWGPAQERQTQYLRVAIRALRQKLERDPTKPEIIINEPAVGYRLTAAQPR